MFVMFCMSNIQPVAIRQMKYVKRYSIYKTYSVTLNQWFSNTKGQVKISSYICIHIHAKYPQKHVIPSFCTHLFLVPCKVLKGIFRA